MDSLLRMHPESFHPDEEDLYRFVSRGMDRDGKIAAHLGSCGTCRDDAELLREMIAHRTAPVDQLPAMPRSLRRELERSEPASAPGRYTRLLSAAGELLRLPFRMPVLALGSAATILILAVVGLPMWRSFQEHRLAEFQPTQKNSLLGRITSREVPEKRTSPTDALRTGERKPVRGVYPKMTRQVPADSSDRRDQALLSTNREAERAEKRELSKSKEEVPPSAQSVAIVPTPSPSAPPAESKEALPSAPQNAPAPAALEPEYRTERQKAPTLGTRKPLLDTSAPRSRMHGLHRAAKKDTRDLRYESGAGVSPSVPITVHITDGQGNPVPWAKVSLPSDLERRFHIVGSEDTESDATLGKASAVKGATTDAKAKQEPALRIEIRIHQSADVYDVDSKLFDASSHREIASIITVRVGRADVPGAIDSSVRRLLDQK